MRCPHIAPDRQTTRPPPRQLGSLAGHDRHDRTRSENGAGCLYRRRLPDGRPPPRERRLLGRAAEAGSHPARRLPSDPLAPQDDFQRPLPRDRGSGVRPRRGAVRGSRRRPTRNVDQRADRILFPAASPDGPCPFRRMLGRRRPARRRTLWPGTRPCVLRRKHGQPRARFIESRARLARRAASGRRIHVARLPVSDRPPRLARRGGNQPE